MPVNYNFRKGVDFPTWDWLPFLQQGISYHGNAQAYDGKRYLYYASQTGSTATTASTSQLWAFDTWSEGWMYLATLTSGNRGMDLEYDSIRNVLYVIHGAALTSWQCFNLNVVPITIGTTTIQPRALATMAPVLPLAADYGASLTLPDSLAVQGDLTTANSSVPMDTVTVGTGSTTTSITDDDPTGGRMAAGFIGLYARFTTGALAGQRRLITAVPNPKTLTTLAFTAAPAAGDTFVVEVPEGAATAATTTTVTMTGAGWTVNQYRNQDVVIVTGTGAGQRKRIASNTADTLTLSAAVTGAAATGPFTTAPAAGSVFRILPSNDFLYYAQGTAIYRIDLTQTTGFAWSASLATAPGAIGGGGNTFYPGQYDPFGLIAVRGGGTSAMYHFDLGLQTWTTMVDRTASETFNVGASSAMVHGRRKIFIQKESSVRCYLYDIPTGVLESAGTMPYANPGAYDGKRAKFVRTADGVEWIYILRAGGQEFFRYAIEWL